MAKNKDAKPNTEKKEKGSFKKHKERTEYQRERDAPRTKKGRKHYSSL